MSSNNFSAPDFSVPYSWAPTFPQTLNTIPYTPSLSDDRPSDIVGPRPPDYVFGAGYGHELPAPAIPPVPAPEGVPGVTEPVEAERPAKRQRLLLAAPIRDGTRPAPAPVQLTARRHVKTSARPTNRVAHACERCRKDRKKCCGARPRCNPCQSIGATCEYKLTPKQLDHARRQAAGNTDPFAGYPGPVENAPVRGRNSRGPDRKILPRPQAPPAGYGSSTAGSEVRPQYFEQRGSSLGGFAARPQAPSRLPKEYDGMFGGFTAGPDSQAPYPRRGRLDFGGWNTQFHGSSQQPQGLTGRPEGFGTTVDEIWQRPQTPEPTFRVPDTRPYRYSPDSYQPAWNFGDFGNRQNGFEQRIRQPAPEFGSYPHTPSRRSSASGVPGYGFGGSSAEVSLYARNAAVGFYGPPPSHGDLPKPPEWSWKPLG